MLGSEVKRSCSVVSDSLRPLGLQPTRLLHPWDFPGKNTGVGCHFLLQEIFPTQGLNPGLPHCGQTLYHLSHQGSLQFYISFSSGSEGKASACSAGRPWFDRWVRKTLWRRKWQLTPVPFCLENPMDGGARQATVHGVAESDRTEQLHFHFIKLTKIT